MLKKKQIQDAYMLSTFFLCATVCACFALLYLRFVDADVLTLFGVFFIYVAVYCFSFVSLKHARTLARELSIEGSIVSPPLHQADSVFSSVSLPGPERPPRSNP
jgi:uncharacterized membrane protein YfcA